MIEIEIKRLRSKLEDLRLQREDKIGEERTNITARMSTLRSDISSLERNVNKMSLTDKNKLELDDLQKEYNFYEENNSYKDHAITLFLSKLPGILNNRKKEKEDPDYSFVLAIYKQNKSFSYSNRIDYGFCFSSIEKVFKKLKNKNFTSEECIKIMCQKEWVDSYEMINFIDDLLLKFPS